VMELADVVLINKVDLDAAAATRAQAQITSALRVFGQHGASALQDHARHDVPVMPVSALDGTGIDGFWHVVQQRVKTRQSDGRFAARRQAQSQTWLWELVHSQLDEAFRSHPEVSRALNRLTNDVKSSHKAPTVAARELLNLFLSTSAPNQHHARHP
jgi:LAO/AO transport system kinase